MPDGGPLGIAAKIAASYKKGQAAGDQAIGNGDEEDEYGQGAPHGEDGEVPDPEAKAERDSCSGWFDRG